MIKKALLLFPDITLLGLFKIWECLLYGCYILLLQRKRFTRKDSGNKQKNFLNFVMWCQATLGPHSKQPRRLSLNSCVLLIKAVDWLLLKLLWLDLHTRRPQGKEEKISAVNLYSKIKNPVYICQFKKKNKI